MVCRAFFYFVFFFVLHTALCSPRDGGDMSPSSFKKTFSDSHIYLTDYHFLKKNTEIDASVENLHTSGHIAKLSPEPFRSVECGFNQTLIRDWS